MLEGPNQAFVEELAKVPVLDLLISRLNCKAKKEVDVSAPFVQDSLEEDLDDALELIFADKALLAGII